MKKLLLLLASLTGFGCITAAAQTFTTLHDFSSPQGGAIPYSGVVLVGNTLFGTTSGGTIYSINTDGSGFTNLYNLTGNPHGGLISSGNLLYGTSGFFSGSVFRIQTNGSGFTNLYNFDSFNNGGYDSESELILSNYILYGTTDKGGAGGGLNGGGIIFKMNVDGSGFTNIHSFIPGAAVPVHNPELLLSNDFLFGVTHVGGANLGSGMVFKVKTDGSGFTNLHNFSNFRSSGPLATSTNLDGARPYAGLILSGNILYGSTRRGGIAGKGTLFAMNTDGTGFTNLHVFDGNEGYEIWGKLLLSGNILYGVAGSGGASSNGTVFCVNTDGTDFQTLYSFSSGTGSSSTITNSDGASPRGGLILVGNTLFGTTYTGGASASGTIFSLTLPPPKLRITRAESELILSWPTNNSDGLVLQATTNLVPPVIWETNFPEPTVLNGRNTVTNPVSAMQMFYRLSQ